MNEIIEFLKVRRSVIIKNIVPGDMPQADMDAIIECGLRVPDHAVIGPWQIKVIQGDARSRLGRDILVPEFAAQHKEATPTMLAFEADRFMRASAVVAVISRAQPHPKIPAWEMHLSAGAMCQNVLTAALALGYAAQWVTEWYSYNEALLKELGGTAEHDKFAGFIYIGGKNEAPSERRRPVLSDIVEYIST